MRSGDRSPVWAAPSRDGRRCQRCRCCQARSIGRGRSGDHVERISAVGDTAADEHAVQIRVEAALGHQLGVRTPLDDPAVVQHDDEIRVVGGVVAVLALGMNLGILLAGVIA